MKKAILTIALMNLIGCGVMPVSGGPCTYSETTGTATIVSVETAAEGDGCNDAVVVTFDFVPDDPSAVDLYETGTIFLFDGIDPPFSWIESEGLTEGTVHEMVRRDIDSGTCSPSLFLLSDVDYGVAEESC